MSSYKGHRVLGEVEFLEIPHFLSDDKPTGKEVLERMSMLCMPKDKGGRPTSRANAANLVAIEVCCIWESKNFATRQRVSIQKE